MPFWQTFYVKKHRTNFVTFRWNPICQESSLSKYIQLLTYTGRYCKVCCVIELYYKYTGCFSWTDRVPLLYKWTPDLRAVQWCVAETYLCKCMYYLHNGIFILHQNSFVLFLIFVENQLATHKEKIVAKLHSCATCKIIETEPKTF